MVAQGAHASMWFLLDYFLGKCDDPEPIEKWLIGGMSKICVRAETREEFDAIVNQARSAGLRTNVITDAGHTEFHGEPTVTCAAIGPNYSEELDKITGHLKLL